MTKKTVLLLLGVTTIFGFVFAAPMMPVYFYGPATARGNIQIIAPGMAAIMWRRAERAFPPTHPYFMANTVQKTKVIPYRPPLS